MKIDVNRKALVNFMINVSCEDSYNDGYAEGYHDACDKEW